MEHPATEGTVPFRVVRPKFDGTTRTLARSPCRAQAEDVAALLRRHGCHAVVETGDTDIDARPA